MAPGKIWRLFAQILLGCAALPVLLSCLYAFVPPVSVPMLVRHLSLQPVHYDYVPLEDIAPFLARAVIAAEDARFCRHDGVDWPELGQEIGVLLEGQRPRGASTITMQLARNLFLWPQRSYLRKALEIPLAMLLEMVLTKERIFELYLNIAEWGPNVFGAEAAARSRFGKPAATLGPGEAARLAVILPAPRRRDPSALPGGLRKRARAVQTYASWRELDVSCLAGAHWPD